MSRALDHKAHWAARAAYGEPATPRGPAPGRTTLVLAEQAHAQAASAPAAAPGARQQADAAYRRDAGSAVRLVADLTPAADHPEFEAELIADIAKSRGGMAMLRAMMGPGFASVTTLNAIFNAEAQGSFDPARVAAAAAHDTTWGSVYQITEQRALDTAAKAWFLYQEAQANFDAAQQRMVSELAQLYPTLTPAKSAAYQVAFWKRPDNAPISNAYKSAIAALSTTTRQIASLLAQAECAPNGRFGQEAPSAELLLYRGLVATGDVAGSRAAVAWLANLGKEAKTSAHALAELHSLDATDKVHNNGLGSLADDAVTVLGRAALVAAEKAAPRPGGARTQITDTAQAVYNEYLTPLSDLLQIYGLTDLKNLWPQFLRQTDLLFARSKDEIEAARRAIAKFAEESSFGRRLILLFVEAYGAGGTVQAVAAGAVGDAIIAFASNGGKLALADTVEHWRELVGMVTEVHDPSVLARVMPALSVAANAVQFTNDAEAKNDPMKGLKVAGDLVAILGSLLEFVPGFPFFGEAIEAVGLAMNAVGDLIDRAVAFMKGDSSSTPTAVQTDERGILGGRGLGESSTFIAAVSADPARSGANLSTLSTVFAGILSAADLTALVNENPELFTLTDISPGVLAANLAALRGALPVAEIRALFFAQTDVFLTPQGTRNLAPIVKTLGVAAVGDVIAQAPALVTAGGHDADLAIVDANLTALTAIVGSDIGTLLRYAPGMIFRAGGVLALQGLWVMLQPWFAEKKLSFGDMCLHVVHWQQEQLDAAAGWAVGNLSSTTPDRLKQLFWYAPTMGSHTEYSPGWWCQQGSIGPGVFPSLPEIDGGGPNGGFAPLDDT